MRLFSNYLRYGASSGTSGTFTPEFEYTGKLIDDLAGLYYYGARFYSPEIDRFITEDTMTGSLDDPLSLNRYEYARDNPEAILDPTGHDWWSSLTNAVSSTASSIVSDAQTVASDAEAGWNSLPPQDQAYLTTGAIVAGAAVSLVIAPEAASITIGAAVSAVSYDISTKDPNVEGVLENAGIGAAAGVAGFGVGGLIAKTFGSYAAPLTSVVAGHLAAGFAQVGIGYAQSYADSQVDHSSLHYNAFNGGVDFVSGLIGYHFATVDRLGLSPGSGQLHFVGESFEDVHPFFNPTMSAVYGSATIAAYHFLGF